MVIMLRKQRSEKFYKTIGFYFCLCSGLVAILIIAAVQLSLSKGSTENQLADLNEPIATQEASTQADTTEIAKAEPTKNANSTTKETDDSKKTNLLENDIVDEETLNKADETKTQAADNQEADDTSEAENEDTTATDETVSVMTKNKSKFDEEKGLLWPMNGDILMNYSADKVVYFATLGQYKCNPALMIKGDVGQEVLCSYKGTVSDISENEETGLTVTLDIGSDYQLVYGQLKNLSVKVGDSLLEGETIGYLAEPTKYFVTEGSHLYFRVNEAEQTVDPLLLLR